MCLRFEWVWFYFFEKFRNDAMSIGAIPPIIAAMEAPEYPICASQIPAPTPEMPSKKENTVPEIAAKDMANEKRSLVRISAAL